MKKTIIALVIAILLISSFPASVFAALADNSAPVSDSPSEQILVKFKPGTSLSEAAQIRRNFGGEAKETIPGIGVQVITVSKGQAMKMAKAYSSNARVAYAEPDVVAEVMGSPDDPGFVNQWALVKIQAPQAWDVTTCSPTINIAILDTGVDLDHPDLAGKIVSNINFSGSNTTDDVYGHGTHVAGIAAAITNNGIGVAGLGYNSAIMNVKVLADNGAGTHSQIAAGIIWAADNGAQIINLSLGSGASSQTLEDAVNYAWSKGVVVVAAAGNNGNSIKMYPAAYANCIAVAATNANDALASWSSYGDWVTVAAPGTGIYSTLKDSGYGYMSGTSMASPFVAGLAALVFTTVSDTNGDGKLNDEVRSRIEATCDDIGVSGIGRGLIDAARAVSSVPLPPGSISGQVTDGKDGPAISGAAVTDGTRAASTDAFGKYTIADVPPGIYQVVASKVGYQSSSLTVTVLTGATAVANLSMSQIIVLGSITGSVTDAKDGSAISGAQVSAGTRTVTTDASGKYTVANVPPGTYVVVASKEGYQSSSLTVSVLSGATAVANFSLSQIIVLGSITGSVTDAKDGSPIVGAAVTDGTRTATTDASGKYTIADVPPGTYQVVASKEGYQSSSLMVNVVSGSSAVANFSLSQIIVSGSITGSVADAKDGSAISGAQVSDGGTTVLTNALGSYTIDNVPAGSYQVVASKEGYQSSSLTVTVLSGPTAIANLALSRIIVLGSITGSVTDAKDGSAIVGATVSDGNGTALTDALGSYTIGNVPPGSYQVTTSKWGYYSSFQTVTVGSGSNAVANFSLSQIIVSGSITGSVADAQGGSPIVGVIVSDGNGTATTDATGKYTIADVPSGNYQVTASKSGYQSSSLTVTVLSGSTAVANFSLSQVIVPGSITGSVTDAKDGSPIVGAQVSDGTRTATTDATGKYVITDVPPGTYQVVASKEGYETSFSAVSVLQGTTAVANFSLSQVIVPGSITGSVTNAKDGSPIVGAAVTDGNATALTDALGTYTIANVSPGTYQVVASKAGYQSSSLTVIVLSGATAVANFSMSQIILPGSITGSVTNAKNGSPIVGAAVIDGTRTATTDATGKYTIANVLPGTYQVVASKEGYQNSSLTVNVFSGGTTIANFSLSQIILPGKITGTVTNVKTRARIAGATVTDGTRTTTTDATGKYTITNVPPGTYQVTASKSGCENLTLSVTVASGGNAVVNFSLSPKTTPMWVHSIQFTTNRNNLVVEAKVVTASGVVPKAKVVLSLKCSNGKIRTLSGTTSTSGLVRFSVRMVSAGSYLATVTSLTCSGFTWDMSAGSNAADYAFSSSLVARSTGLGGLLVYKIYGYGIY
jgi:thermitase